MSTTLLTTWTEYDRAVATLLDRADRELCIFDEDLARLGLDRPERHHRLREFLLRQPKNRLRIVVQRGERVLVDNPRLARLLEDCAHKFSLAQAPEHLAHLADALLIADGCRALVRFHRDQARSKLVEDDPEETGAYGRRFDEIWHEGLIPLSGRPAGL